MPHLRDGIEDDLATVILNNPPQNRLSVAMLDELAQGLDTIGQSAARAVLLRADGPDFSFGGDMVPWLDASMAQLLFQTEDVNVALPSAIRAFKAGKPRPVIDFKGQ